MALAVCGDLHDRPWFDPQPMVSRAGDPRFAPSSLRPYVARMDSPSARTAVFNPKSQGLKAKWLVRVRQTFPDGSYVEEPFAFKGKGTLSPLA